MTQAPPAVVKIPTKSPQPSRRTALRPAPGQVHASGTGRAATRGGGEVIQLEHGITVYPARSAGGDRCAPSVFPRTAADASAACPGLTRAARVERASPCASARRSGWLA